MGVRGNSEQADQGQWEQPTGLPAQRLAE